MSIPVISTDLWPILGSFLAFETCVGVFLPCAGVMRSKVLPDEIQGSVMNIFRVPLNIFVVVGTKLTDLYPAPTVFSIIVVWLLLGAVLQVLLASALGSSASKKAQ